MSSYSKPTDVHAYISPSSCTAPHLNSEGVSIAKTVGTRLRALHSRDQDLLQSLNLYAGYLLARGYQELSIKYHLSALANRNRMGILKGHYRNPNNVAVPLVVDLHPAVTCLSAIMTDTLQKTAKTDPLLNILLPKKSVFVSYRRLPNLTRLLCIPDQNKLCQQVDLRADRGYLDTGCRCQVCSASNFGRFVCPPSLPGYKVPIIGPVTCTSGPAIIYHLQCKSGKPECRKAHYTGSASTTNPALKPMSLRWSNHKSHHNKRKNMCAMTNHLMTFHPNENAQDFLKITILEQCENQEIAKKKEAAWAFKLFSYYPSGLNVRDES